MAGLRLSQGIVSFNIGLGLVDERQGLRRIDGRRSEEFAIDKAMQQVQHMRLGRNTGLQRHVDGGQDGLFIVLKDKRQDIDHLPISTRLLKQVLLQGPECIGELGEWCAVAKSAGLTLHHCQIMPPVIDGLSWAIMGTINDATMLANDLTFCRDDNTIRVDPKAYRSIGEGCRNAVAIALQMHEAGGRDPLRIFDEPVERPGEWHESRNFLRPDVGNSATHLTVGRLGPELFATLLEPIVQGFQ